MQSLTRRGVTLLLLLVAPLWPGGDRPPVTAADQQTAAPQFRGSTDLTRIEVSVLDQRTRLPIRGLTADDLVLEIDGKPRPIALMSEIVAPDQPRAGGAAYVNAARDVASNPDIEPRLFLIVMDDALMTPVGQLSSDQAAKAIANRVVDSLGPNDLAAVIFPQDNSHAQDFTADRSLLRRAIATFHPQPLHPQLAAAMSLGTLKRGREFLTDASGYRRALLWISIGMPLSRERQVQLIGIGANVGEMEANAALEAGVRGLVQGSSLAAVPIYIFSPEGLMPPTVDEIRSGSRSSAGVKAEMLRETADRTGGRAIVETNAPQERVADVFRELSSYYILGYRHTEPLGLTHRVQVKIRRPGVIVVPEGLMFTTRKAPSGAPRADTTPPRTITGLMAALAAPISNGNLDMHLATGAYDADAASRRATVVMTTGVVLLPRPSGEPGDKVLMQVSVYNAEGRREVFKATPAMEIAARTADADNLYELALRTDLAPGRYQVRVSAEREGTAQAGGVFMTLDVPDFVRESLSASAVAIGRSTRRAIGGRESLQGMLPFAPTTARTFSRGDLVGALLRIHQAAKDKPVALTVDATIATSNGDIVWQQASAIPADRFSNSRHDDLQIDLPLSKLDEDDYLLKFTVKSSAGKTTTREVRFSVR